MIIWINGAFGAGKSSVAECLADMIEKSQLYDPEQVGYFLWNVFPESLSRKGDFQDLPMWRGFNYEILKYIYDNFDGTLVVPMTLADRGYYNEIVGRLAGDGADVRSFILRASKAVLDDRLVKRGDTPDCWAAMQGERCIAAFESGEIPGEIIDTEKKCAETVAEVIFKRVFMRNYELA